MSHTNPKSWSRGLMSNAAVLILAVLAGNLTAAAQDQGNPRKRVGLSFKVSGGLGYLLDGAGDINAYRKGMQGLLSDVYSSEGHTNTFDWPRPWFLPDLTADIIITVGSHFGLGFGTGLIPASYKGRYSVSSHYSTVTIWGNPVIRDISEEQTANHTITVIPLRMDLYVFLPVGKAERFTIFARTGIGYYKGRAEFEYPYHVTSQNRYNWATSYTDFNVDYSWKTKCSAWGFQGGLGLEFKISRAISLGAEIDGRYVNFKNWEGDLLWSWKETYQLKYPDGGASEETSTGSEKWHGFLWTFQLRNDETKRDYTHMMLYERQPTDRDFKNIRKSAINLNAVSIALSLKVHFDLF